MTHKLITLKDVYKDYFKIGVAVNPTTLRQDGELIRTQFNSITAENHMKPEELQPEEGIFTFEKADMIADFAKENLIMLTTTCITNFSLKFIKPSLSYLNL